jgi:hypothetical protein
VRYELDLFPVDFSLSEERKLEIKPVETDETIIVLNVANATFFKTVAAEQVKYLK